MAHEPALNADLYATEPADWTASREAAERARDDEALLRLRGLEVAGEQLPPVIDGLRRGRLLTADALATTWDAWDAKTGERALIRCIRPEWRRDAVMLRRLARAQQSPDPPRWAPDGAWPHLRADAPGALLLDRFPIDDPPDTVFMARVLGAGLRALTRLHAAGLVHGGPILAHLVEERAGPRLVWLDRFGAAGGPERDLSDLGRAVAALDPLQEDPVALLAQDWIAAPPPSAEDGARLLSRLLATTLLDARHRHELSARRARRQTDVERLGELARALATALPPPRGRFCMRADPHGILVLVESDGGQVRGGAALEPDARFLPVIYEPGRLDAQATRAVLRAWSQRDAGDREHRAEVGALLGTDDRGAAAMARWLSAMSRLRALVRLQGASWL